MQNTNSSFKSLTWGIIGCGRVSANHAWAAKKAGLNLKWACDLIGDKALKLSKDYNIQYITERVEDLIEDDELDIISIATDHSSHIPIASLFLNKQAILIEKPLGIPSQDIATFIKQVEQSNCHVSVVSQHRFDPHVRQIMEAIHTGKLGKIELVRARTLSARDDDYYSESTWRGKYATEGGSALINQGYHALDTLLFFFGYPSVLGARVWTHRKHLLETEEGFECQLKFKNDIHAELFGTTAGVAVWDVVIEIYGSKGHIIFDLNHPNSIRESFGVNLDFKLTNSSPPPGMSYYGTSHLNVIKDIVRTIKNKKVPTVILNDAKQTLDIISNIYNMAETNLNKKK